MPNGQRRGPHPTGAHAMLWCFLDPFWAPSRRRRETSSEPRLRWSMRREWRETLSTSERKGPGPNHIGKR